MIEKSIVRHITKESLGERVVVGATPSDVPSVLGPSGEACVATDWLVTCLGRRGFFCACVGVVPEMSILVGMDSAEGLAALSDLKKSKGFGQQRFFEDSGLEGSLFDIMLLQYSSFP